MGEQIQGIDQHPHRHEEQDSKCFPEWDHLSFTRVGFSRPSFDRPASGGRDAAVASVGVAPGSSSVAWAYADAAGRWASPAAKAKGQRSPPAVVLARLWSASARDVPA